MQVGSRPSIPKYLVCPNGLVFRTREKLPRRGFLWPLRRTSEVNYKEQLRVLNNDYFSSFL